jgi:serine/threonine protein kinase
MSVPGNLPLDRGAETATGAVVSESPTTDHPDFLPQPLPAIAGFRIVRRLGGGGMGEVYEAIDEKIGVAFALKIVRSDRSSLAFAERFRQEVRAMMGLDHPNIARIFRHDEADGRPYFTMKFVRGGTLADRRKAFVNRPREAVGLMLKVIDAVEYLHRQGQVHRDLKPSNILLDESGEPFLSDFGLVKDVAGPLDEEGMLAEQTTDGSSTRPSPARPTDAPTLTRTGGVIGTYAYMSPEQARGKKSRIGPTTDVWALGVILYELLSGHRPGDENETRQAGLGGVDPALARIVNRCLSEEPAGRYPSAALLAADLRRWLQAQTAKRQWRPAAILAASLLLIGVLITMAIVRRNRDKNDPLSDLRAAAREELRAGRPVTLVDGEGNATAMFRLLGGGGTAHSERDPDGWWRVDTTAETLAEFLDDPGIESFTLSGEVRGNRLASIPRAGLFVAHRRIASPEGDWHFQLEYLFEECPDNFVVPPAPAGLPVVPPKSKVYKPNVVRPGMPPEVGQRVVRLHASQLADGPGENPEDLNGWDIGRDDAVEGGPWRKMGIRASVATFAVSWAGQEEYSIPEINVDRLNKMQLFLREKPDPPLAFKARGGLGVYVSGGSASFRNLTIVPGPAP